MKYTSKYLLGFLLSLISCVQNTLEPALDPQITNTTDHFEFKISDVRFLSDILEYRWKNSGITANIYNGSTITEGEVLLEITDLNRIEVFSGSLKNKGNFFTTSGIVGDWTIKLHLKDVKGTIHFRIDRRL